MPEPLSRLRLARDEINKTEPVEEPPIMPARELLRVQPVSDVMNSRRLLDHLVGGREQRRRHGEAERLGGFEVDDKFEL